ncbi:UNVERIFIED_CONTAM: hypothetical protein HDU68_005538 [Siphonaria sp. JEL0065]|nr:hypothetical protein HDU68_005538 [Siphonaria sp. JEL0065]
MRIIILALVPLVALSLPVPGGAIPGIPDVLGLGAQPAAAGAAGTGNAAAIAAAAAQGKQAAAVGIPADGVDPAPAAPAPAIPPNPLGAILDPLGIFGSIFDFAAPNTQSSSFIGVTNDAFASQESQDNARKVIQGVADALNTAKQAGGDGNNVLAAIMATLSNPELLQAITQVIGSIGGDQSTDGTVSAQTLATMFGVLSNPDTLDKLGQAIQALSANGAATTPSSVPSFLIFQAASASDATRSQVIASTTIIKPQVITKTQAVASTKFQTIAVPSTKQIVQTVGTASATLQPQT